MFARTARIATTLAALAAAPVLAFVPPASATSAPMSSLVCSNGWVSSPTPQVSANQAFAGSTDRAKLIAELYRYDESRRAWLLVQSSGTWYAQVGNNYGNWGGTVGYAGPVWSSYSVNTNRMDFRPSYRGWYAIRYLTADPHLTSSAPSWTAAWATNTATGSQYCYL